MKHEINIDQLGEILAGKARAANREIIQYYGSDQPDLKNRMRLLSQISLIRELGIPAELHTDEAPGKELYTAVTICSRTWEIKQPRQ
jgi:hypothetical protein